jgi:hypothetical protein
MTLSITTWNINSVRLRLPIVQDLLRRENPDILCLQEIKCQNDQFPAAEIAELGYSNIVIHGQKGYHGVAICSKLPLTEDYRQDYCGVGDSRHISAIFEWGGRRIRLHNFYVPRRRRRAKPRDESEIRPQARLHRGNEGAFGGGRTEHRFNPRRRPEHRTARARRLVTQADAEDRQPHTGRDRWPAGGHAAGQNGWT